MKVKKVKEIGLSKFTNTGNLGFHVEADKFFDACGAKNISCVVELPLYASAIAEEADVVNRQRSSVITAELEQMDKERNGYVSYILATADTAKHAPTPAGREAHRILKLVLKPYKGLTHYTHMQESGGIIALLKDLRAVNLAVHITTLALKSTMDLLDTKNNEYVELDKKRILETPSKMATDAARATTDGIYREMVDKVNATVVLTPNDEAVALVEALNHFIDQTNHYYNIRTAPHKKEEATEQPV